MAAWTTGGPESKPGGKISLRSLGKRVFSMGLKELNFSESPAAFDQASIAPRNSTYFETSRPSITASTRDDFRDFRSRGDQR